MFPGIGFSFQAWLPRFLVLASLSAIPLSGTDAATIDVQVTNFAFNPASVSIKAAAIRCAGPGPAEGTR